MAAEKHRPESEPAENQQEPQAAPSKGNAGSLPVPAGKNPEPDVILVETDETAKAINPKKVAGHVHVPDVFVAQVRPK